MTTFESLGIRPEIVRALTELGFESPMPVQEKVIPLLLGPKTDIVALAQTGTGKTAAYGLPLIQQAETDILQPQALILCPTRELCVQITGDLNDFAKYINDLHVLPVYGGSSMDVQIKALKRGVQIVVATPGRLIDLINRRAVKLGRVKSIVLDEADEMLNMGFLDSINEILAEVPEDRSTLLFSATMPSEVAVIARNYMTNPAEITIGNKNAGAENIKHLYYTVHAKDKYLALKRIVDYYPSIYGIVFCRTRMDTQEIADKLIHDGYNAEALHGDLSQSQRDLVMQKFRIRHVRLLVATDVAARGIDVDDLTHIINYNLPDDIQAYTHRSGRTGRAGKAGTSIAIINTKEKNLIKQIEKKINKPFIAAKVPGGREICEKQLFNMINKMENVEIEHAEIDPFLPSIYKKLDWLDKEDIIKRFVALEFNRFLDYYRDAKDINVSEEKGRDKTGAEKPMRRDDANFVSLYINVGKVDGLYPATLIELVNANTHGRRVRIGNIELSKKSAIFEVEAEAAAGLIDELRDLDFRDIPLVVDYAKEKRKREDLPAEGGKWKGGKTSKGGDFKPGKRVDYKGRKEDQGDGRQRKKREFSGGKDFQKSKKRRTKKP